MNDSESESMTPHESASAPAVLAKTLGLVAVAVGLATALIEGGAKLGRMEAKVEHAADVAEKHETRLSAVEAETRVVKQDVGGLHDEVKGLHDDVNRRFDRQMTRLDAIAERVGAKGDRH